MWPPSAEAKKRFTHSSVVTNPTNYHFFNDDRAKIKLEINNHTGSKIKEIKEYTAY